MLRLDAPPLEIRMAPTKNSESRNAGRTSPDHRSGLERGFLEMMIDHHGVATKMAEACLAGAVRPELEERAAAMRADQDREIGQMRDWLRIWHDTDKTPTLSAEDRSMVDRLERLSGDALERAFLSMMVEHHGVAIRKAKDAAGKMEHEAVASFCRELVRKQETERDDMRRLLRERPVPE